MAKETGRRHAGLQARGDRVRQRAGRGSNTASYDALDAAFSFDAEAIYFLSDGAPQGGSTTNNPEEIVQLISQMNRTRRESIYSLGIAVGIPDSPFDLFLKALAEENFGSYRRVDQ